MSQNPLVEPEVSVSTQKRSARLWSDIREALAGSHQDFTEGSIGRAIFLLSIPMVLEMFMQSIFEVADIFFVGKLGADAVAAVGLSASLIILVFAVAIGLSMAATAIVARRIGEKNPEGASVAAVQTLVVGGLVSLPIAIIGIVFAPDLLRLMGATESVIEVGTMYCAVIFGGNLTVVLLFLINAIFRGAGDAAIAMRSLWLANILNIVLDPLFIFGWAFFPEMGVTGAAVATVIGRGVGVAYQLSVLFRGTGRLHVRMDQIRLDVEVMKRLLRISWTGIVQFLVGTASWMLIMRIVAAFGSAAVAGYTIAVRVIVFALLPSWGMGNAASTLVGQNLGAGKPERAERSVWTTAFINMIILGIMATIMFFWARPIVEIFTTDQEVVPFGVSCLKIVSFSYLFWAFGMVTVQAFNGAGDTVTPTWINLFVYWLFQIPLAFWFAFSLDWGSNGVFVAIAIAQSILAVVGVIIFRQGRWKTRVV